MPVRIKYFASVREFMGKKDDVVEINEPKYVIDILNDLKGKEGKLSDLLMDKGQLKKIYKVMINGRDIEFLDGIKTKVRDGDEISIFPPVGGG
jgi:molybdopterin synthase sulfur carrier subunit